MIFSRNTFAHPAAFNWASWPVWSWARVDTGWRDGRGFVQLTGSQAQRGALARIAATSLATADPRRRAGEIHNENAKFYRLLEQAMGHLLRAERFIALQHLLGRGSWGEAWISGREAVSLPRESVSRCDDPA